MPIILALAAISMGWLLVTGKIQPAQIPSVLLGLVAVLFLVRGEWVGAIIGIAVSAAWFRGVQLSQTDKDNSHRDGTQAVKGARILLGAAPHDGVETIRALHRKLIADNHPDKGGTNSRAAALNEARDLLLTKLLN